MGVEYVSVQWNRQKRFYDAVLIGGVAAYLAIFGVLTKMLFPHVCQHQNGPLGEGKIVFGCITCPWHGCQYQPDTGASPPPFVEKVPTFNVRVKNGRVFVNPQPNPAGARAEPAIISAASPSVASAPSILSVS